MRVDVPPALADGVCELIEARVRVHRQRLGPRLGERSCLLSLQHLVSFGRLIDSYRGRGLYILALPEAEIGVLVSPAAANRPPLWLIASWLEPHLRHRFFISHPSTVNYATWDARPPRNTS